MFDNIISDFKTDKTTASIHVENHFRSSLNIYVWIYEVFCNCAVQSYDKNNLIKRPSNCKYFPVVIHFKYFVYNIYEITQYI
jgi:hypothetical protein